MDTTKKGHFLNINPKRKSWCFERFSFNVGDKCLLREDESSQSKIKYRFDYRENSCRILETNQCTFNGNVFNTIEECLVDCWPSKFECQNCDIKKFNSLKAQKCKSIVEGRVQCGIKAKIFNMDSLINEVQKLRTSSADYTRFHSTNLLSLTVILFIILQFKNSF